MESKGGDEGKRKEGREGGRNRSEVEEEKAKRVRIGCIAMN